MYVVAIQKTITLEHCQILFSVHYSSFSFFTFHKFSFQKCQYLKACWDEQEMPDDIFQLKQIPGLDTNAADQV